MKILCIGEALIDMICTDKGKPLSAGENFLKKAGGAPANVAAAIGALGGQVQLAAKVGVDPFGQHLIQMMESFGVDTTYLCKDSTLFTTFAFVSLMESGERDFYFNRGADANLSMADLDAIQLSDYGIVHFGSATAFLPGTLHHTYQSLLQQSREAGLFISFDPNYRQLLFGHQQESFVAQSIPFLKQSDFYKVSDEEAMLLTNRSSLAEAVEELSNISTSVFAITLGKEGTLLMVNGQQHIVPSIAVKVTDTTGAGDAFVGALLYQLSEYSPADIRQFTPDVWMQKVANANKAGARTCMYMGAMEAFRHLSKSIFDT